MSDPVETPIDGLLDAILKMDSKMEQESCGGDTEPMIRFGTGAPPVINFNIPEGTAFTTYGHMLKYIDPTYFRPFTIVPPANNYYEMMENMSNEQATKLLHPNVAPGYSVVGGSYIPGSGFVPAGGSNIMPADGRFTGVMPGRAVNAARDAVGPAPNQQVPPGGLVDLGVDQWGTHIVSFKSWPNVVDFAKQNLRPMVDYRILNQGQVIKYIAKPPRAVPRITIIEEYTTVSYLGDYGAGRVVKTFSLYPGERTTISVRTYKDMSSTSSKSDNMLDSFSESSATELDTLLQKEQGDISSSSDTTGGGGSSYSTNTDSKNSTTAYNVSGGLNFGIGSIGGGYGQSESDMSTSGSGMANHFEYGHTGARQSNINTLNSAMNKHVQQSNANRQVEVNTSTTDTARSGEEDTTVRELINYNKSRVLNLVCRQLNQKYTTVTYLSDLKFQYSNGYLESNRTVDLNNLKNMLIDIIKDGGGLDPNPVEYYRDQVLCKLLQPYCHVLSNNPNNFTTIYKQFINYESVPVGGCLGALDLGCGDPTTETFFRKNPACIDEYNDGVVDVPFKGVILSVQEQVLHTSSVIWDALLGRGEALDCFNMKAQEAENQSDFIQNLAAMQSVEDSIQTTLNNDNFAAQQLLMGTQQMDVVTQQKTIIENAGVLPGTPADQAAIYKKVFGSCCPTPQYTGGCGCGNCNDTP